MQSEYRFTAQETWDAIAVSFDTTRQKPWSYCLEFIHTRNQNDIIADLGCGNGRHLIPCAERCTQVIGVDISPRFLHIIEKKLLRTPYKNISLIHADVVQLPFEDSTLNAILFIASLHNIKGREHRRNALREIYRVLKPKGTALISVWSRWQKKFYKYFLKQFFIRKYDFGDIDIYWRQHNLNIPRFYHLYSKSEFLRELQDASLNIKRIESVKIHSKKFPDNFFAVVKKG